MTAGLPRPEDLHTTEQAAKALDVPAARIRRWRHEGLIAASGYLADQLHGGKKRPMYYLTEIEPLAKAYHHRLTQRATPPSAPR